MRHAGEQVTKQVTPKQVGPKHVGLQLWKQVTKQVGPKQVAWQVRKQVWKQVILQVTKQLTLVWQTSPIDGQAMLGGMG